MNPDNGEVKVNKMTPGETATYSCNTGFELEGADTVTCATNGMWTEGSPLCRCGLAYN